MFMQLKALAEEKKRMEDTWTGIKKRAGGRGYASQDSLSDMLSSLGSEKAIRVSLLSISGYPTWHDVGLVKEEELRLSALKQKMAPSVTVTEPLSETVGDDPDELRYAFKLERALPSL
jgi:hypothetical protein